MTGTNVNWEKIEKAFRAGILSVRQIAKQCLSDRGLAKRAKRLGWTRDLTARVQARAAEKLTLALAGSQPGSHSPRAREADDEETIEQAALTQVAVVREHSHGIRRGLDLTARLMHEFEVTTTKNDELLSMIEGVDDEKQRFALQRAVSLPARATVMRDLAQAARVWINLERQAFRISDDRMKENPSIIENMTEEELRASILEDLRILDIEVPKAIAAPGRRSRKTLRKSCSRHLAGP
jgi:hypothetical protein